MKSLNNTYPYLILIAGLLLTVSCTEDTTEQDALDQEKRYFELYVAANYPDAVPEASGLYFIENKGGTVLLVRISLEILAVPYFSTYFIGNKCGTVFLVRFSLKKQAVP